MWSLLQLAAALAVPLLVFAALLWVLMYSSFRLALRHEVTRLGRQEEEASAAQGRPRAGTRPASAQGNGGQARPGPARDRAAAHAGTQSLAGERRAAS